MTIEHNIIKKKKQGKKNSKVSIDLYPLASELYHELNKIGAIGRLIETPQLGIIRVNKALEKSRYDYVILQMYYHQIIKANLKNQLKYSYNNYVPESEFFGEFHFLNSKFKLSIMDIIQILVLVYNIGHYRNTFVSSRAAVLYANESSEFKRRISEASDDNRYQQMIDLLIEEVNYRRFHLINSWLILEQCDGTKESVNIAKGILYSYIFEKQYQNETKMCHIFDLFRIVRNVAYISYDLQIANTPLTIDLCDSEAMLLMLKESMSIYSDNRYMGQLMNSISKLLNDTVYNEESNVICYYKITSRIISRLKQVNEWKMFDFYRDGWNDKSSLFNDDYYQTRDFEKKGILKITISEKNITIARALFSELTHTNEVSAGYYDRSDGSQTIVVAIKKSCLHKSQVALRVVRIAIKYLRKIDNILPSDFRYLLCAKFFLFYLTNNHSIVLRPTISREVCVICTMGRTKKIREIEQLILEGIGSEDELHEVENLTNVLKKDQKNDVCLSIPSSILVYVKGHQDKPLCEFDGMIIYPNRKEKNIVFLEAKNRKWKKSVGKNDLIDKLKLCDIPFSEEEIEVVGKDAVYMYTV